MERFFFFDQNQLQQIYTNIQDAYEFFVQICTKTNSKQHELGQNWL